MTETRLPDVPGIDVQRVLNHCKSVATQYVDEGDTIGHEIQDRARLQAAAIELAEAIVEYEKTPFPSMGQLADEAMRKYRALRAANAERERKA